MVASRVSHIRLKAPRQIKNTGENMKEASGGLFHHLGLRKLLVKLRVPIGMVAMLLLAKFAHSEYLLAGFLVSMFGLFIQIWCFASLDKNATLTARGPYTMVRNPMYLGRFFIMFGFLILLGNWWLMGAFSILYWLYMNARVQREEKRLIAIFTQAYAHYCATVRRFIPQWPATGEAVLYWNWQLCKQNHAALNLFATVAAWIFVAVATIWGLPYLQGTV
jgi:protein-S-isoprenylcysteine O-methyltransferase Ste14